MDDIDGSVIDDESGETIESAVNGVEYVIDLKAKNANEFHKKIHYYIEHAVRVGGRKRKPSPPVRRRPRRPGHRSRVTRRRHAQSGSGPPTRGTRSMTAGASRPPSKRRTTRLTDLHSTVVDEELQTTRLRENPCVFSGVRPTWFVGRYSVFWWHSTGCLGP